MSKGVKSVGPADDEAPLIFEGYLNLVHPATMVGFMEDVRENMPRCTLRMRPSCPHCDREMRERDNVTWMLAISRD